MTERTRYAVANLLRREEMVEDRCIHQNLIVKVDEVVVDDTTEPCGQPTHRGNHGWLCKNHYQDRSTRNGPVKTPFVDPQFIIEQDAIVIRNSLVRVYRIGKLKFKTISVH